MSSVSLLLSEHQDVRHDTMSFDHGLRSLAEALATIIAEAVEGRSAGCAALHTALALLVDGRLGTDPDGGELDRNRSGKEDGGRMVGKPPDLKRGCIICFRWSKDMEDLDMI